MKEILTHDKTWMNLEDITISKYQTDKYYVIPLYKVFRVVKSIGIK